MKIAVISNRYYPTVGGAEINTHGILKELAKKHEVTVLTPFRVNSKKEELLDGVKIKRYWSVFNPFSLYPYNRALHFSPAIITEIMKENYDLIHMYPSAGLNYIPYFLPKLLKKKPLLLTVYDLAKYSISYTYKFLTSDNLSIRTKWILRQFDCIFAISTYELDVIRKINNDSFYIPCGTDLEDFDGHDRQNFRESFQINSEFVVLDVSRIIEYKGQHILIEAIPDIIKQEKDVIFVFVGPVHDEQYYLRLRNLVNKLNIKKHVLFTGSLSWNNLLDAYFACDLHVLPIYFITFPDTVIEAWAANKPVLVSNRVDPPWIVKEGEDGLYFDIGNKKELVEKILILLHNKKLRDEMGIAGRKKVEEKFTFKIIASEIEEKYSEIIKKKGGRI